MKNEGRETIERINSVINGLGKDSKWSKAQRKIEWEIEHHQERLLWKRQDRANAHFEHSKENIEKLLKLNKHLHELQDECAKTAFNMYKDLIALMKQGLLQNILYRK